MEIEYLEEKLDDGCPDTGTYGGFYTELSWRSRSVSGLPCIIWVECGEEQPRGNNPRIKFCVDKNQSSYGENLSVERIPMMICDEPHIPEGFRHMKHNLTDEELAFLKEWVRRNKELLLDLGEGKGENENCIASFCKKLWKGERA